MKPTRVCQLSRIIKRSLILAAGIFFLWGVSVGHALDPDEILVIATAGWPVLRTWPVII